MLRNGAAALLGELMRGDWLTHLATNGAGTIHDWEYSWLGRSTESVRANVATGSWFGLFAPAGTPASVVQQVQKDIAAVLANPKVRQAVEERGFIPVGSTSAEFGDTIKKEAVQWQKVIKDGNIKPE